MSWSRGAESYAASVVRVLDNDPLLDEDPDSPVVPDIPPPLFEDCLPPTLQAKRQKRSSKRLFAVPAPKKEGQLNDVLEDITDIDRHLYGSADHRTCSIVTSRDDLRCRTTFDSPPSIYSGSSGGSHSDPSPSSSQSSSLHRSDPSPSSSRSSPSHDESE